MNNFTNKVLDYINANTAKGTDSDKIQKQFPEHSEQEVLKTIDSLCGSETSNGYITWRRPTRNDYADIDRIHILPKGEELLSTF